MARIGFASDPTPLTYFLFTISPCSDAEAEVKKEEWREIAKRELEDWYKHREEQLEKSKANNRCVIIVSAQSKKWLWWFFMRNLCDKFCNGFPFFKLTIIKAGWIFQVIERNSL